MKTSEKEYENKISSMQHRISNLLKEVASLSKSTKRDRLSITKSEAGTNSGSGTDSPVPWWGKWSVLLKKSAKNVS